MGYSESFPEVEKLTGKKAILLLGTDQYIGEGLDNKGSETRVGVTPDQVEAIKNWLESNGAALDFFFVKGAGTRADFLDSSYLQIGGQVLFEHQLSSMPSPHVFHALKEPCSYETFIPGPFLRIGALHISGGFEVNSGVAFLLKKRNFCAIFDGSHIGTDTFQPIRGPMSDYAGRIAVDEFIKPHFNTKGISEAKIVISGGGVAGNSALTEVLNSIGEIVEEIVLVESNMEKVNKLKAHYRDNPKISIQQGSELTNDHLKNANAVILAAFIAGKSAPDVLNISTISSMADGSIIVDISIDEKGGIFIPGFDRHSAATTKPEVREKNLNAIERLQKRIVYIADDHMPMLRPKEASIAHGIGILPYIAMLLYCSAKLGGPKQTAKYILKADFSDQGDLRAKEILEHLRRGLAFYNPPLIEFNENIINDPENRRRFESFLSSEAIEFESFD